MLIAVADMMAPEKYISVKATSSNGFLLQGMVGTGDCEAGFIAGGQHFTFPASVVFTDALVDTTESIDKNVKCGSIPL